MDELARTMNPDFRYQLHSICRQHQRTIWVNRVLHYLPTILWWNANILFMGAMLHHWILPLNSHLVISIAILPCIISLVWLSILHKPAEHEAASAADRLINANSLFITAWELSHSDATLNQISRLLIKRAESSIPVWSKLLSSQHQRTLNASSLAAITLAVSGLWLLLQTTHIQPVETTGGKIVDHHEILIQKKNERASILSELFLKPEKKSTKIHQQKNVQNLKTKTSSQFTPQASIKNNLNFNDNGTANSKSNSPSPSVSGNQTRSGIALTKRSKTESHNITGLTAGNETARHSDKQLSSADKFEQVQPVDIEIEADNSSIAFDESDEGQKLVVSPPQSTNSTLSYYNYSNNTSNTTTANLLSAEQRYRVWRYFKQLEKINEPNK